MELIGELRAANPHVGVLVLTASAERGAYARAVEAGAAGVLNKSVTIGEVIGAARSDREGGPLGRRGRRAAPARR